MEAIENNSSNSLPKLHCCRACLSTDKKLFNIHEYKLADAFSRISGIPVSVDGFPQYLCAWCGALLMKCMSFRAVCLRAQEYLTSELTTDSIRTLDRSQSLHNLTSTTVQTIDYIDIPPVDIKQEPIIDFIDIESIINPIDFKTDLKNKKNGIKNNNALENGIVKENKRKRKKVDAKASKKLKLELDIEDDNDEFYDVDYEEIINKRSLKKKESKVKKKKIEVNKMKVEAETTESKDNDLENVDNNDDVYAHTKPVKAKRKRKKKEEVTRKFRNPDNDYMPVFDFGTFERTYGVQLVTLTKEEQLAEIEARKASPNYQSSPFRCEDCGKGFLAEGPYSNHRQRHSPSIGPHACEICSVRFKMQCRRQEHQDLHRLKFLCQECGFVSRNRHQARRHHDVHAGKTFECQHCGKTFTKSSTYLSHVRLAHPAMNVACDMCGETFVGHVGLRQHKTKMHSENTKPEQFKCPTCPATFVSLAAVSRHTDTLAPHGALHSCARCGQNCASADLLLQHKGEHKRCDQCDQTFLNAASYDLHHRRKHLNQRYSSAGRRVPRRVPRVPPAGRFVCELCGRLLPNATLLRYHQRIHQDVKPFACPLCPRTFAAKHSRDWHIRTHTGERPYQCPLCPLAFSLKGNLKRHHKAVHLGLRAAVPCSFCRRTFSSRSVLRAHVNTKHRGLPWPKRSRARKPAISDTQQ